MNEESGIESTNPMGALLASARARAALNEVASENEDEEMKKDGSKGGDEINLTEHHPTSYPSFHESSRRAFDKVFKTVLSFVDILLYVLDARDPNETRSQEIERQGAAADAGSKRLILILNKIDLVPPEVLKSWLTYLRRETLLRALKTYAHGQQLKRSITVGIVGYPNVGKSSVINALTSRLSGSASSSSRTACPVGAEAGITTALREVKLDNKLKLLDSPGIVFPSSSASDKIRSEADLILLNALPPKQITDPLPAISLLLARPGMLSSLLKTYDIPALLPSSDGDLTVNFLVQVARERGRLGKGGVPNLNGAAMRVLSDWRDGRVQGWVDAPVEEQSGEVKTVVKEWAKEFKLEGLWGEEGEEESKEEDGMEGMER